MTVVSPDGTSTCTNAGTNAGTSTGTSTSTVPPRRRRRGRRRVWLAGGVVVVVGAAAGGWFVVTGDGDAESVNGQAGPAATTVVTRETIIATESFDGILGHGDATTVTALGQGVVTRLAAQDSEVARGTEIYRLDEQPVTAMYGALPMYRDIGNGAAGIDVEQLEANLVELGYTGFAVDATFDSATETAVRAWQADAGAAVTGVVARSGVVFVPDGGRVDALRTEVGATAAPGSAILDITGDEEVVSMDVEVSDRDLLEVDAEVTVQFPDGDEADGTVTSAVVVPAEPSGTGGGGGGSGGGGEPATGAAAAVTKVEIAVAGEVDESMLNAPVDVVVGVDRSEDVLVVPVNALLALGVGDYGLEVVAGDGTTSTVPVETGLFVDGRVEIEGDGIDEGTRVGVAGR